MWLPIDAKFPGDTYAQLRDALDSGDREAIVAARKQLETRIKAEARDISTKYVSVPATTNFGIMFLPFEGLYAEAVSRLTGLPVFMTCCAEALYPELAGTIDRLFPLKLQKLYYQLTQEVSYGKTNISGRAL